MKGSENNDRRYPGWQDINGRQQRRSASGGITSGMPLVVRVAETRRP
jgi:chorismate synthase